MQESLTFTEVCSFGVLILVLFTGNGIHFSHPHEKPDNSHDQLLLTAAEMQPIEMLYVRLSHGQTNLDYILANINLPL